MGTFNYGPENADDDDGLDFVTRKYLVSYQSTADILSIFVDDQYKVGFTFYPSRTVGKLISKWYFHYVCNGDVEFFLKRIEAENNVE